MKRITMGVVFLAGFVFVASAQQLPCKYPKSWAEFHRHNMQRRNPCEHVLNIHNVGSLSDIWLNPLGGASTLFSPVIVDGVMYVASGYWGFHALKAGTGETLWSFGGFYTEVWGSPAVAGGRCYFGSDNGNIYALDATSGTVLWSYPTLGVVRSAPTVLSGMVYDIARNSVES
jgi:outer membrane protein assembly factor BamB